MVFFDIFNEDNFKVDNQELVVQPVTTSELKKEYIELGVLKNWTIGEQSALKDGTIVNRTYKELDFRADGNDFDLVDLGYYDETFGGNFHWRVLHEFTETEYYSSNLEEHKNFKIWEKSINNYQMEVSYDNLTTKYKVNGLDRLAVFTWQRPTTVTSFPGLACPTDLPTPPPNETGPSQWSAQGTTVETDIDTQTQTSTSSCKRFNSLPKPFYLVFDAGKSLGAVISNTDLNPTTIYLSTTPTLNTGVNIISTNSGTNTNPHKMKYRYLILKWDNPGRDILTKITVTFKGNEIYRSFLPLIRDTEPECPEHFDTTPYIAHATPNQPTRYKPPNEYHFPDNFWNDVEDTPLNNYAARLSINPSSL
jgi:hypothetical protein